jgi:hypothetical protein
MTECDNCGTEVTHVWRHRAFESDTHRTIEWVCATCHPELPDIARIEPEADSETVPVTDGGRSAFVCPSCTGPTVNGQGLFSCVDCDWVGPY